MKKVLFFLAVLTVLCVACEPEPWYDEERYEWEHHHHHPTKPDETKPDGNKPDDNDNNGNNNDNNGNSGNNGNNGNQSDPDVTNNPSLLTITRLYSVVMRREIPWPFKAYVMQVSDGNYFYMLRLRYNKELHVGDQISFGVFSFCPHEIARINGVDVGDVAETPEYNEHVDIGQYLVASDPIEGTVKHLFSMEIRYSITIWPIDTLFLELENGDLIFVKKSKLDSSINIGDRVVYSVYTLFPNEVVAIKKL